MSRENRKTIVSFRLRNDEVDTLHKAAKKSDMSVSEYLRALVSLAPIMISIHVQVEEEE